MLLFSQQCRIEDLVFRAVGQQDLYESFVSSDDVSSRGAGALNRTGIMQWLDKDAVLVNLK